MLPGDQWLTEPLTITGQELAVHCVLTGSGGADIQRLAIVVCCALYEAANNPHGHVPQDVRLSQGGRENEDDNNTSDITCIISGRPLPALSLADSQTLPVLSLADRQTLPVLSLADRQTLPALSLADRQTLPVLSLADRQTLPVLPLADSQTLPVLSLAQHILQSESISVSFEKRKRQETRWLLTEEADRVDPCEKDVRAPLRQPHSPYSPHSLHSPRSPHSHSFSSPSFVSESLGQKRVSVQLNVCVCSHLLWKVS
ncbi:hypothetical protein C0Q70_18381 [Pomacea canaliculata]|uniref:Uncharacterized protein n=1 Tax=Pomacea canaliculata TaxID=400727 RepID=A0A2T7NN28_POMCA|nr:hypothetical protein C0Q70_18381 [Pomacea canaliculata]